MKRIKQYKELFNVEQEIELPALKKAYRNLVKEWHPDKFQEGDAKAVEAEVMSRKIIDGYHFLISIAPETKAKNLAEYTQTCTTSNIDYFQYEKLVLEVTFTDGTTYEYFGVPTKIHQKMVNTPKQMRFARRHIFNSYTYRKSKKGTEE